MERSLQVNIQFTLKNGIFALLKIFGHQKCSPEQCFCSCAVWGHDYTEHIIFFQNILAKISSLLNWNTAFGRLHSNLRINKTCPKFTGSRNDEIKNLRILFTSTLSQLQRSPCQPLSSPLLRRGRCLLPSRYVIVYMAWPARCISRESPLPTFFLKALDYSQLLWTK